MFARLVGKGVATEGKARQSSGVMELFCTLMWWQLHKYIPVLKFIRAVRAKKSQFNCELI